MVSLQERARPGLLMKRYHYSLKYRVVEVGAGVGVG